MRISRVHRLDRLVALLDDLMHVYMGRLQEPDWDRLAHEFDEAIDRCSDPEAQAALERRLALIREELSRALPHDDVPDLRRRPQAGGLTVPLLIVLGGVVALAVAILLFWMA